MPSFFRNLFAPRPSPIGIDFGSEALRLSQVMFDGSDFHLIAAATAPVPIGIRQSIPKRMEFFTQTVMDLLAQGKFRGRRAVLGLPSAWTFVQNLRTTQLDPAAFNANLPKEWATELGELQLRHLIAGEIKKDSHSEWEVVLMAARKAHVDGLLAAAVTAGLDVRGMTVEMSAMVDCFTHVYRRKADANSTVCYLDLGTQGTRVVIARGGRILLMRSFPFGGDELNNAVASRLKIHVDDARLLRKKLSHAQTASGDRPPRGSAPESQSETTDAVMQINQEQAVEYQVEKAIRGPLYGIVQEVHNCRREHEVNFPAAPVDRIVLCGGEARNDLVCKYISSTIGLATQVGDPMVRLSKSAQVGAGIDRRQPQPMWAISLGLTMGPAKLAADSSGAITVSVPAIASARKAAA